MSKLYRIKPLVWEKHGHVHIAKTPVYEFRVGEHEDIATFSIRPGGPEMERVFASSVEDAKDACRRWWEANATQFLEPAYQPTTELPTEPGLYWWRPSPHEPWRAAIVNLDLGITPCWFGSPFRVTPREDWEEDAGCIGQWVRIPEPEEEG